MTVTNCEYDGGERHRADGLDGGRSRQHRRHTEQPLHLAGQHQRQHHDAVAGTDGSGEYEYDDLCVDRLAACPDDRCDDQCGQLDHVRFRVGKQRQHQLGQVRRHLQRHVYATFTTGHEHDDRILGVLQRRQRNRRRRSPRWPMSGRRRSASNTITLGTPVAASGNLVFTVRNGSAASTDRIGIDNVVVNYTATTTTTITTVDLTATGWTATYTENGAPVSIADTDSSIFDASSATMASASISLTEPADGRPPARQWLQRRQRHARERHRVDAHGYGGHAVGHVHEGAVRRRHRNGPVREYRGQPGIHGAHRQRQRQ